VVSNWGGKMGDGVDSYGKWLNVGLHKLNANLRVAQATLAGRSARQNFLAAWLV